jgi:hypothetical protein
MIRLYRPSSFATSLLLLFGTASGALAATNVTNSLTGFTGNSTQAATQTALAAAGFTVSSTEGNAGTYDPTITFDASGAHFGTGFTGDGGRNYMRTNDSDYAKVNFTAQVTMVVPDIDAQDAYVGLGPGDINPDFFRTPDIFTNNSSVMYWGENEIATPNIEVLNNANGQSRSVFINPATGLGNGTHRMQLAYDRFQKLATFSFDLNYAGGPFTPDYTTSISTASLYSPDGWPTEPSRVFFGGDDGIVFKDFNVQVSTTPITLFGDFNNDSSINSADWAILRTNNQAILSGLSQTAAYQRGDMDGNLTNDHEDFALFKIAYDQANGAGAFQAMLAGVPEPSTAILICSAGLLAVAGRKRARIHS